MSDTEKNIDWDKFWIIPILMLLTIPISLYGAWVLQKLYGWFLLPLGLPELNIWHTWGLMLIVNVLRYKYSKDEDTSFGHMANIVLQYVVFGLIAVATGFLLKGHI